MGYKTELFTKPVDPKFTCSLCKGVVITPVRVGESSMACCTCLATKKAHSGAHGSEVKDMNAFDEYQDPAYVLEHCSLEMKCLYYERGCPKVAIPLVEVHNHLAVCRYSGLDNLIRLAEKLEISAEYTGANCRNMAESPVNVSANADRIEAIVEARITQPQILFTSEDGQKTDKLLEAVCKGIYNAYDPPAIAKNIKHWLYVLGAVAAAGCAWRCSAYIEQDGDIFSIDYQTTSFHVHFDKLHVLIWEELEVDDLNAVEVDSDEDEGIASD